MGEIQQLVNEASAANDRVAEVRQGARIDAIAAIRLIERALSREFVVDGIRGLFELAPDYYGARVRGQKADARVPPPNGFGEGREILVIARSGHLEMVKTMLGEGNVLMPVCRRAADADLMAEDLELYSRVVDRVLRKHLDMCRASTARYGAIRQRAQTLIEALAAA